MASAINKYEQLGTGMPSLSASFRHDVDHAPQHYLSLKQMGQAQLRAPEPDSNPEAIALGGMSDLLMSFGEAMYSPKAPAPSPAIHAHRPSFSVLAPC